MSPFLGRVYSEPWLIRLFLRFSKESSLVFFQTKKPMFITNYRLLLSLSWLGWYVASFGYAYNLASSTAQLAIWGSTIIVLLLSTPAIANSPLKRSDLTFSLIFLGLFFWSLTSQLFSDHLGNPQSDFDKYIRAIFQNAILMFFIPISVKYTKMPGIFLLGPCIAAIISLFDQFGSPINYVEAELLARTEQALLPDRLGGLSAIGTLCVLALYPAWVRSSKKSIAALSTIVIFGLGVILSASRGAVIMLLTIILLWPLLCATRYHKNLSVPFFLFVLILASCALSVPLIFDHTNAGRRFLLMLEVEDGSTQTRLELALNGLQLWADNPIFGVGLGNYPLGSGTFRGSHAEFIEILSTTGIIGSILLYSFYARILFRSRRLVLISSNRLLSYKASIIFLATIVILVSGAFFELPFLRPHVMAFIAIMIGWLMQLEDHNKKLLSPP